MKTLPALLVSLSLPALASEIVPPQPIAFEPVNLRMTVDGCAFVPSTVRVSANGNTLQVTQHLNNCFAAGPVEIADVRLGSLAPGRYRVEVYWTQAAAGPPAETLAFDVVNRAEIAVFPPPPRPIADYSGMWWNPSESGWGLSLHQSPTDVMFGALFVYGADGKPEWFTLQGGTWESATRWNATLYRTNGPFFASPEFDPRLVLIQAAGEAALDFGQVPGDVGRARFTYTVDGARIEKILQR